MPHVTTLFLDFASHEKSVALVTGNNVVALHKIDDHTDESKLMPLLETMWANAKPDRIVAATGPGGFMSLRVGLSLANTLSWSLKIPIAGVHLSEIWHLRAPKAALWLHSTKKELLFIRGFGPSEKTWPEATLLALAEASEKLKMKSEKLFFIGELIEHQQNELGVKRAEATPLENVLPALCDGLTYDDKPLMPWYGRGA